MLNLPMPGMMDTVLNVGMADDAAAALGAATGDGWFAWDTVRRFVQSYSAIVLGAPSDVMHTISIECLGHDEVRTVHRFTRYRERLEGSLAAVAAGDLQMIAHLLLDSDHTVWFELHEELIRLTGRTGPMRQRPAEPEGGDARRREVDSIFASGQDRNVDSTELTDIDLTDTEIYRNGFPHEVFTTLRSEQPVSWHRYADDYPGPHDPGFWALTKYEDIQAANRDPELFSAYDGPALALQPQMSGLMLVTMDGRDHARQRKLISKGFTPRMVARLDEQARARAITIVDEARERATCDFVRDIAYKLPMHMIADIVGIPPEDREHVFTITTQFLLGTEGGASEADHLAVQIAMFEYAKELGRRKRSEPEDDVWTILSTVEIEADDGKRTTLSESELDLFFMLLTIAGSETTRNAISLGMLTLLDHPDQLAVMRTEPDAMRGAVEEILRWASPVSYFARRATRDTEVRGVPIAAGDRVTLWYPSANRDEDAFDQPFTFDIGRNPNPHISFGGGGPHYCLGANLARREITILFEELLARTQEVELVAPAAYARIGIYSPVLVALETMPVRLA